MNKQISIGSIGVINLDDDGRLYRANNVIDGLVYLQSIDGALSFRTVCPWHFWILLDSF